MSNEEENLKASSSSQIAPPLSLPSWVELPPDIMANILERLGVIEILESAQRVCSTWWNVCHNPTMWRVVDLKSDPDNIKTPQVLEEICRVAVDRSQGQLLKLCIENFGNTDLLNYVAERCSQLKHLRLVRCNGNFAGGLAVAAKNFPLLEELDINSTSITKDDIEMVGLSCPLLKSLILDAGPFHMVESPSQDNDRALVIGKSMPELRHLTFRAHNLTYEGLQAIFEGCPHLESPDLGFY
ncbi:hypothetical protein CQW23_03978 [Capsicum baccatum]|uniref:F-box domain-containing protein n=1 Tax=Capsicum baccatum TaxID=33114 RepID=A0A2G2XDB3_CAPBA|nr:hypothetical protein CQW23_03978 [Capsicum baccatum]